MGREGGGVQSPLWGCGCKEGRVVPWVLRRGAAGRAAPRALGMATGPCPDPHPCRGLTPSPPPAPRSTTPVSPQFITSSPAWMDRRKGGGHTQTHPGPIPTSPSQRVHVSSRGPGWGVQHAAGVGCRKGGGGGRRPRPPRWMGWASPSVLRRSRGGGGRGQSSAAAAALGEGAGGLSWGCGSGWLRCCRSPGTRWI